MHTNGESVKYIFTTGRKASFFINKNTRRCGCFWIGPTHAGVHGRRWATRELHGVLLEKDGAPIVDGRHSAPRVCNVAGRYDRAVCAEAQDSSALIGCAVAHVGAFAGDLEGLQRDVVAVVVDPTGSGVATGDEATALCATALGGVLDPAGKGGALLQLGWAVRVATTGSK